MVLMAMLNLAVSVIVFGALIALSEYARRHNVFDK